MASLECGYNHVSPGDAPLSPPLPGYAGFGAPPSPMPWAQCAKWGASPGMEMPGPMSSAAVEVEK